MTLADIKPALGIFDDYHDATLQPIFDSVYGFIRGAGVAESQITAGLVARGVNDMWDNDSGGKADFSPIFMMMLQQAQAGSRL